MLTLVFGKPISKGKVNRSLDLCLIAKETTGDCEQGFVFKHVYFTSYIYKLSTLQVTFTSYGTIAYILFWLIKIVFTAKWYMLTPGSSSQAKGSTRTKK